MHYPREPIPNGELPMSQTEKCVAWVVYLMTLRNHLGGMNAVCEQMAGKSSHTASDLSKDTEGHRHP